MTHAQQEKKKITIWRALLPIFAMAVALTAKPLFGAGQPWETTIALGVAVLLAICCPKRFERQLFIAITLAITSINLSEIFTSEELSVGREIWLWCFTVFFGFFGALALFGLVTERSNKDETS